jgi:hypothetical protein
MLLILFVGIAVLPAAACELEQKAASHRTVTAFLTQHASAAASTPLTRLVACKADGSACAADAEWLQRRVQADWRRTRLRIQINSELPLTTPREPTPCALAT